jgi:hypothetical protein
MAMGQAFGVDSDGRCFWVHVGLQVDTNFLDHRQPTRQVKSSCPPFYFRKLYAIVKVQRRNLRFSVYYRDVSVSHFIPLLVRCRHVLPPLDNLEGQIVSFGLAFVPFNEQRGQRRADGDFFAENLAADFDAFF